MENKNKFNDLSKVPVELYDDGVYTPFVYEDRKLEPFNEALYQLLDKHSENGYIIVSLCNDEDDCVRKLITILKKSPWSYMPVYGGFIENKGKENETVVYEKSFMIFNYDKKGNPNKLDDLFNFGVELSKKFNQDSFLYHEPGKKPTYYKYGKHISVFSDKMKFNDYAEMYFTGLHQNTHEYSGIPAKVTRFKFIGCYANPKPQVVCTRFMRDKAGEIFLGKNIFND
jgi:hypothetical protein